MKQSESEEYDKNNSVCLPVTAKGLKPEKQRSFNIGKKVKE